MNLLCADSKFHWMFGYQDSDESATDYTNQTGVVPF
jgi:hypothetical protein